MQNTVEMRPHLLQAFLDGVASALNIKGDTFEMPEIKTDAENIRSDWESVGSDLITATKQLAEYGKE